MMFDDFGESTEAAVGLLRTSLGLEVDKLQ